VDLLRCEPPNMRLAFKQVWLSATACAEPEDRGAREQMAQVL